MHSCKMNTNQRKGRKQRKSASNGIHTRTDECSIPIPHQQLEPPRLSEAREQQPAPPPANDANYSPWYAGDGNGQYYNRIAPTLNYQEFVPRTLQPNFSPNRSGQRFPTCTDDNFQYAYGNMKGVGSYLYNLTEEFGFKYGINQICICRYELPGMQWCDPTNGDELPVVLDIYRSYHRTSQVPALLASLKRQLAPGMLSTLLLDFSRHDHAICQRLVDKILARTLELLKTQINFTKCQYEAKTTAAINETILRTGGDLVRMGGIWHEKLIKEVQEIRTLCQKQNVTPNPLTIAVLTYNEKPFIFAKTKEGIQWDKSPGETTNESEVAVMNQIAKMDWEEIKIYHMQDITEMCQS